MADNLNPFFFFCTFSQVEVKIDNSRETSKDNVLDKFTIEAALYDTGGWYKSNAYTDLVSSNVANLKLNLSSISKPCPGFHGYLLAGKLAMPRLWSAEQVRKPIQSELVSNLIL